MKRFLSALAFALALLSSLPLAAVAAAPQDYSVNGGWFYSQAGGGNGKGFNVLDSGLDAKGQVMRFYSEFNRLGGVAVLGYPSSGTFSLPDGFTYQATQAGLMQWHPEDPGGGSVELANIFDILSQAGHDSQLQQMGIPPPIADDGSGGNFAKAVQTRLSWLTNPAIKAKYLSNPNPAANNQWTTANAVLLYGLPTSLPQRAGPFLVQRFQRVAFQLWLDSVPGQPSAGTVVPILGGDLAKQFAVVPAAAQTPQAPASPAVGQAVLNIPAVAALQPAVALLTQFDQAHGTAYMKNLSDHHVAVTTASLSDPGALGFFSPDTNTIEISDKVVSEDVHDLADLIAHESSHALDLWTHVDITSVQGCYNTEVTAFKHQADVWRWFYPQLKPPPDDPLEQFLNGVADEVANDPSGFVQKLTVVYHHQCAT